MHVDGGGVSSMWTSTQKKRTDVLLSSSHAKKMAFSLDQNFAFGRKKVETFRKYKLVFKVTYSTVLNKLQAYCSRIPALCPNGHFFKRVMCFIVDVHKGGGRKRDFLGNVING